MMQPSVYNNKGCMTPARQYAKGIGDAVADRTVNRIKPDGTRETWADVAYRVSLGNSNLLENSILNGTQSEEFEHMHHHLRQASILMSGRHLQHGDESQPTRNMEVFTNCSTSASSFLLFYLLLNGSGVGRSYDNLMSVVDWSKLPIVIPVIKWDHKDCMSGGITALDKGTAEHFYKGREHINFSVPDSREGWAVAIEMMETLAFEGTHRDKVLILDFSDVRPRNAPIFGMQGRPASGPGPLMSAIKNVATLRDAGMEPWRAAMYADHYLAECVLVGGARRAARMATKTWRDKNVLDFVEVKRGGFLWSANNSVTVDGKFWRYVRKVEEIKNRNGNMTVEELLKHTLISELEAHAFKVFEAVCYCSYHDGTGEPGLINQDKMPFDATGIADLLDGDFAESKK